MANKQFPQNPEGFGTDEPKSGSVNYYRGGFGDRGSKSIGPPKEVPDRASPEQVRGGKS